METIKIQGTDDTPGIIFDAENKIFQISGRSMPEDVTAFYEPLLMWLEEYSEIADGKIIFEFKLEYFNTASSKLLLDVLMKLEDMFEDGKGISVKWYFPDDDEDMEEAGEEYADIVDVPIELISYED